MSCQNVIKISMLNIPSTLPRQRHSACHSNMLVIPHSLYLSSTADGKPQDDNSRVSGDDQLEQLAGLESLQSEIAQNKYNCKPSVK